MSFSHTYFEELREQSKDLVEILAHTQEERVLYALCVVYQQLAFAEQDPPFDAEDLLQQHAERLEKYVQSKNVESMLYQFVEADVPDAEHLYDLHELAFVLDYLDIEEDHVVPMVNIQKVIQSVPELYVSLCARAQALLSVSVHPSRFFDDVLQAIVNTAQAQEDEPVRLSDDEIEAIFAKVEAEEAEESESSEESSSSVEEDNVVHMDFSFRLAAGDDQEIEDLKEREFDRFTLVLERLDDSVDFYLYAKGESISGDDIAVFCDGVKVNIHYFDTAWTWKANVGTWSIHVEGKKTSVVVEHDHES